MAKKKKGLSATDFENYLKFISYFSFADVYVVDEQDYPMLMELFPDKDENYLHQFERVVRLTFVLKNKDFMDVVSEMHSKEFIKHDIFIKVDEYEDEIYILELVNDKSTKRKRKTKVELELELEEALDKEDFELAAKLRDRINKMK